MRAICRAVILSTFIALTLADLKDFMVKSAADIKDFVDDYEDDEMIFNEYSLEDDYMVTEDTGMCGYDAGDNSFVFKYDIDNDDDDEDWNNEQNYGKRIVDKPIGNDVEDDGDDDDTLVRYMAKKGVIDEDVFHEALHRVRENELEPERSK